jgi:hypothetical protein
VLNAQRVHKRARRVLPEALATSGVLLSDESPQSLSALLFPLRRKSSGALAFRLCAETAKALAADPLGFLSEALEARQGLSRHCAPMEYKPWRAVKLPGDMGEIYFTSSHDGGASILIVPAERLAVYLWRD